MRVLAFSLLAFLTVQSAPAVAAGVLLPSDSSNNATTTSPNLGLTPTTTDKAAASDATTPPAPATSTPSTAPAPATPAATNKPTPTPAQEAQSVFRKLETNVTPTGSIAKNDLSDQEKLMNKLLASGAAPKQTDNSPAAQQLKAAMQQIESRWQSDPTFLDDQPLLSVGDLRFTGSLAVTVSANYLWGASDLKLVQRTLGYDTNTIPSQCQLRLDTSVQTDQDMTTYRSNIMAGRVDNIGYIGALRGVTAQPRAVCNKPATLPRNGGIIMRTGDKLTVQLSGPVNCTLEPNQSTNIKNLEIQFLGNGKAACKFS